jgi:hypothetical protein
MYLSYDPSGDKKIAKKWKKVVLGRGNRDKRIKQMMNEKINT